MLHTLIRQELDNIMRLASAADVATDDVTAAVDQFIDKILSVVKTRNNLEKR